MVVNLVFVLPQHQVTVHVYDEFAVEWDAIPCFVFFAYSFRKQSVQDTEVYVHGSKFVPVGPHFFFVQAVHEFVELDKPAAFKRNPNVFSAKIPKMRYLEGIVKVKTLNLFR